MARWLRYCVWLAVPLLVLGLIGKPIFLGLNGVQYAGAYDVFRVLLVGVWLSLLLSPLVNILIGRRDFRFLCLVGAFGAIVSVLSNYVLIRSLGAVGAGIATVLTINIVIQLPILWRVQQ